MPVGPSEGCLGGGGRGGNRHDSIASKRFFEQSGVFKVFTIVQCFHFFWRFFKNSKHDLEVNVFGGNKKPLRASATQHGGLSGNPGSFR